MAQKQLLTNGNVFRRTDKRWGGTVWYMDEQARRKRKSFSGTTKAEVNKKIKDYITNFENELLETDESRKLLKDSMTNWLKIFKFPMVEATTYDRLEMTARNQIYPVLGDKVVTGITSADIRKIFNKMMMDGYAYSSVKKVHDLLNDYFRYLVEQELISKNPMVSATMIKKANFMSMQGKEMVAKSDAVTVFTKEEVEKFKEEAFRKYPNGTKKHQQPYAYILMLNTGIRTGEALGLINSDIDLEEKVMHITRGVKEVSKRDGVNKKSGREIKVGKLKTATSRRDVPLNNTAIEMIKLLREEMYFGEDAPLIPDENGNFTKPVNFRKRFYRILKEAGIETKGLHSLRHTFATNLINGIEQKDGTVKSLTPRQVADLLGHTTSEITEQYYVKRDMTKLKGVTNGFEF